MATVAGRVEGLDEAIHYLKQFDKETLKALNKELYGVMKDLVVEARSLAPSVTPMSGWAEPSKYGAEWGTRLLFDARKVKTGIRSKIGTVRHPNSYTTSRTYLLINANPAGAIYETAGRKSEGKGPNGRGFIRQIENDSGIVVIGKQGRIVWKAVNENRATVVNKMEAIVKRYEALTNRKLAA